MKQEKVRDTLNRSSKGLFRVLSGTTVHSIATIILEYPENPILIRIESEDTKWFRDKCVYISTIGTSRSSKSITESRETNDVRPKEQKSKRLTESLANLLSRKSMTVLESRNRSRHSGMNGDVS